MLAFERSAPRHAPQGPCGSPQVRAFERSDTRLAPRAPDEATKGTPDAVSSASGDLTFSQRPLTWPRKAPPTRGLVQSDTLVRPDARQRAPTRESSMGKNKVSNCRWAPPACVRSFGSDAPLFPRLLVVGLSFFCLHCRFCPVRLLRLPSFPFPV